MNRFQQVVHYAWKQSKAIASQTQKSRLALFFDMVRCYQKYRMWTNQYIKEKFYEKNQDERESIGADYLEKGKIRDAWQKDFRENREFYIKYGNVKYERASLRQKRNEAYTKRYHAGEGLFVEHDVNISRQHYLEGTITIGKHVLFAKHVFIDYSGEVIIHDGVKMANGVIVESHHRDLEAYKEGKDVNIPTRIEIGENAYIGTRAIILDSCNYIGKFARIGAGAVVTKDIPDYAVAVGVPAKVIKILPHDEAS